MYNKVLNDNDFVKDSNTGALLNTNKIALEHYRQQRRSKEVVKELEAKVCRMDQDINDIKCILSEIRNKICQ